MSRSKAYYQANIEKMREYHRKYREEHREEIAAYQKQYREEHEDQCREYNKAYREKHKEQIAEYKKAYHQAHKYDPEYVAKRSEYHAKWQRENKDKWNAYMRARNKALKGGE